jgi:hypothetical protein
VREAVTKGLVRLGDEQRFEVPVGVVCPEFSPPRRVVGSMPAKSQSWPEPATSNLSTSSEGSGRCSQSPPTSLASWAHAADA